MAQTLHDSGKRRTFKTGAIRDRGDLKPRPDLISPHAQMREGMIMTLGAQKYATRNWEKGMPISECIASAQRHIEKYKRGDIDEDHLAQARWNLGAALHFEEEIKAGRLPPELNDMPRYATPKLGDRRINPETGEKEIYVVIKSNCGNPIPDVRKEVLPSPTFYIAGPMRGIKDFNFPEFDRVAKAARARGFSIINPAELDRVEGIDSNSRIDFTPEFLRSIAKRDCEAILKLKKEQGDGLILLPNWLSSIGARAEVALALWLGLIFRDPQTFGVIDAKDIKYTLFDLPTSTPISTRKN